MRLVTGPVALLILLSGACRSSQSDDTEVKVVGGSETKKGEYDSVIRLLVDVGSARFCTGVVVSETTVLMAGHCIKNSTLAHQIYAERPSYMKAGSAIKSHKIYAWSAIAGLELLNDKTIQRDLAIVTFPKSKDANDFQGFKGPYVKIASSVLQGKRVDDKELVTIVGYGANELSNDSIVRDHMGVKRAGQNVIDSYKGHYLIKGTVAASESKTNAVAASGDAGAPLLNKNGELIAIGAGMLLAQSPMSAQQDGSAVTTKIIDDESGYPMHSLDGAVYAYNAFVDLSSKESQTLMAYAVWKSKSDGVVAIIPGVSGSVEPTLSENDKTWLQPNSGERTGPWVAMTGGGKIATEGLSLANVTTSGGCTTVFTPQGPRSSGPTCGNSPQPTRAEFDQQMGQFRSGMSEHNSVMAQFNSTMGPRAGGFGAPLTAGNMAQSFGASLPTPAATAALPPSSVFASMPGIGGASASTAPLSAGFFDPSSFFQSGGAGASFGSGSIPMSVFASFGGPFQF
jgi:hypothetical protein